MESWIPSRVMRQTNRLQLSFCLRLKGTPFASPPLAVWAYNGGRQVLSYDVGSDGTSKQPSTTERTSDTGKVGAFTVWVYDHHTIYTCRHKHIYTNRSNAPNANTNSPTMALFSGMLFRLHSTCLTLPQPAKQEWWSHERSALGHHLPALLQMKWCDFVARAFAPPSQSTNKRT